MSQWITDGPWFRYFWFTFLFITDFQCSNLTMTNMKSINGLLVNIFERIFSLFCQLHVMSVIFLMVYVGLIKMHESKCLWRGLISQLYLSKYVVLLGTKIFRTWYDKNETCVRASNYHILYAIAWGCRSITHCSRWSQTDMMLTGVLELNWLYLWS